MIETGENYVKDRPADDPQTGRSPGKVIVGDAERNRQWKQERIKVLEAELKECEQLRDKLRLDQIKRQQQADLQKELQRQTNLKRREAYENERDSLRVKITEAEAQMTQAKKTQDASKINEFERQIKELKDRFADLDKQRLEDIDDLAGQENERRRMSKIEVQNDVQKQIELESRRVEIENELDELRSNHKKVWRSYTPLSSMKKIPAQDRANRSNEVHSFTERSIIKDSGSSTTRNIIGVVAAILFIIIIAVILHCFIFTRPTYVRVPVPAESPKPSPSYSQRFYTDAHGIGAADPGQGDYSRRFEDIILSSNDLQPIVYSPVIVPVSQGLSAQRPNQAVNIQTNTAGNNGNPSSSTILNSSTNSNVNTLVNSNTQQNTTEEHKNTINIIPMPANEKTYVVSQQPGSPFVVNNYNHPVQHSKVTNIHHQDDQSKSVVAKDIKNVKMGTENTNVMNQSSSQNNIHMPTTINETNNQTVLDNGVNKPVDSQNDENYQKPNIQPFLVPSLDDKNSPINPIVKPDKKEEKNVFESAQTSTNRPIVEGIPNPLEPEESGELQKDVSEDQPPKTSTETELIKPPVVTPEDLQQQKQSDVDKIESKTSSQVYPKSNLSKSVNVFNEKIAFNNQASPPEKEEAQTSQKQEPKKEVLTEAENKENKVNVEQTPGAISTQQNAPIEEFQKDASQKSNEIAVKIPTDNNGLPNLSTDLPTNELNSDQEKKPNENKDEDKANAEGGEIDPKTGKPIVLAEKIVDEINPLTGEVVEKSSQENNLNLDHLLNSGINEDDNERETTNPIENSEEKDQKEELDPSIKNIIGEESESEEHEKEPSSNDEHDSPLLNLAEIANHPNNTPPSVMAEEENTDKKEFKDNMDEEENPDEEKQPDQNEEDEEISGYMLNITDEEVKKDQEARKKRIEEERKEQEEIEILIKMQDEAKKKKEDEENKKKKEEEEKKKKEEEKKKKEEEDKKKKEEEEKKKKEEEERKKKEEEDKKKKEEEEKKKKEEEKKNAETQTNLRRRLQHENLPRFL